MAITLYGIEVSKSQLTQSTVFDVINDFPRRPKSLKPFLPDLTDEYINVDKNDSKRQLVFPIIPIEERVEVNWVWIWGKPKYGKTTKCHALVERGMATGRYDPKKTQVMEGEDLVAMLSRIKPGTECVFAILNDAHKKQSSLKMMSQEVREAADFAFLARHIFKEKSGLEYGTLTIFANAQEFKSILKWLRDQAVMDIFCSYAPDNEHAKNLRDYGTKELQLMTLKIEHHKDQSVKNRGIVWVPSHDNPDLTVSELTNPRTAPVGFIEVPPLNRRCKDCGHIERSFFRRCSQCKSTGREEVIHWNPELTSDDHMAYLPWNDVCELVPIMDETLRTKVLMMEQREFLEELRGLCKNYGINPLQAGAKDLIASIVEQNWFKDNAKKIKFFRNNKMWLMSQMKGLQQQMDDTTPVEEDKTIYDEANEIENDTKTDIRLLGEDRFEGDIRQILELIPKKYPVVNKDGPKAYAMYWLPTPQNPDPPRSSPSQASIAEALGYKSQGTVSKWINKKARHPQNIFKKLSLELGLRYERWVFDHIAAGFKVPGLIEFEYIKYMYLGGGSRNDPDILICGKQKGDDDLSVMVLSLKCYNSYEPINLIASVHEKGCLIRPEYFTLEFLTEKSKLATKKFIYSTCPKCNGRQQFIDFGFKDVKCKYCGEVYPESFVSPKIIKVHEYYYKGIPQKIYPSSIRLNKPPVVAVKKGTEVSMVVLFRDIGQDIESYDRFKRIRDIPKRIIFSKKKLDAGEIEPVIWVRDKRT